MQTTLWRWIERAAWWLDDPQEGQTVVGDIQERGATFAALLDLTGLVLLRQLAAWKSWKTWALSASLVLQFRFLFTTAFLWSGATHMGWLGGWIDHQNHSDYIRGSATGDFDRSLRLQLR